MTHLLAGWVGMRVGLKPSPGDREMDREWVSATYEAHIFVTACDRGISGRARGNSVGRRPVHHIDDNAGRIFE